ncbi:VOC family protein [Streptomyces sp. NPDC057253]|uniref:VOC family protein n=1 Tax=Streptomyces sp. NPDC057253 TaxID=3346069 RepID=UPI003626F3DE
MWGPAGFGGVLSASPGWDSSPSRTPTPPVSTVRTRSSGRSSELHMCFKVKQGLDQVEARLLELGAGRPDHQPHGTKARVLTDPVGHPFCIVKETG